MRPLWSARLRKGREGSHARFGWGNGEHFIMPEPDELQSLGKRLDKARRQSEPRREAPPTPLGIASRLATEMVVAVAVGGGLGWLLGRIFGMRAVFLIVML